MPQNYPQEILEISEKKTGEDPTLLQATDVPGSPDTDEEGNVTHKYAPFAVGADIYVRKPESTLDWKSYRFEMVMGDGTRNDFVFSAKDDGDAQRKVRDRIATTSRDAAATFKLLRLETPKELDLSEAASGLKTVAETKTKGAKADKAADKRAKAAAKDANAEKADEDEA